MASLTLGVSTVHVTTVVPGRAADDRRLAEALAEADPYCLAVEVDAAHALALRQRLAGTRAEAPFLARLVADAVGESEEDVFLAAARHARDADVPLVPLLPTQQEPGFFERRRLRRLAAAGVRAADPARRAREVEDALRGDPAAGRARRAGDLEAGRRLARLLFEDDRTRVVAVLTEARADRVLDALRALAPTRPRDREAPRERASAEVRKDEPYPPYR